MRFNEVTHIGQNYPIRSAWLKLIGELRKKGLSVSDVKRSRLGKVPHLRIQNTRQQIDTAVRSLGGNIGTTDANLSGKFSAFKIVFPENIQDKDLAGMSFDALINLKQGAVVSQKMLTPANLGLSGKTMEPSQLVNHLKKVIPQKISNQLLSSFLIELVDVAVGKKQAVDSAIMGQISPDDIRQTGIDFGEILTPLVINKGNISFPGGSNMLADVEIGGQPYSVKSATGSGTSFKAIKQYMDSFSAGVKDGSISLTDEETELYNFHRTFIDTPGDNLDKIIAASHVVNTEEHNAMAKILRKQKFNKQDLIDFSNKFKSYKSFLNTIYPASIAGGYSKPTGLPADAMYYLGKSSKQPKVKTAGKPSWDNDQGKAGMNIITYILGTSFLADAKKVEKAAKHSSLIKRVLGNVNASLAKVDITSQGTIKLIQKPFSQLDYKFQYHAPSHIAGNNLPGFSLVV